jgi:ABC-type antimicrobial peptide transport system permease subunit
MTDPLHIQYDDLKEHDRVLIYNAVKEIDRKYEERTGCTLQCEKEVTFIFNWMIPIRIFGTQISLTILFVGVFAFVGGSYALIKIFE